MIEIRLGAIKGQKKSRVSTIIFGPLCFFFSSFFFSLTFNITEERTSKIDVIRISHCPYLFSKVWAMGFSSTRSPCHTMYGMRAVATHLFLGHIVPGPLMCFTCQLLALTTQGLSLSSAHMQDTIEVLRSS